jgi:copper chaperone CopZ
MQMTVSIPGIHCKACETLIRDVSTEFPQITSLSFDLSKKQVQIVYDEGFDFNQWSMAVGKLSPDYQAKVLG